MGEVVFIEIMENWKNGMITKLATFLSFVISSVNSNPSIKFVVVPLL